MVNGIIKKVMRETLDRLGKKENVNSSDIGIFIHTKQEDLSPQYFYTVSGGVKTDEEGQLVELDFVRDILNKKMDLLGYAHFSGNFLKNYFKATSEENQVDPHELYVQIGTVDNPAKELLLALYKGNEQIKTLSLEEVFGD